MTRKTIRCSVVLASLLAGIVTSALADSPTPAPTVPSVKGDHVTVITPDLITIEHDHSAVVIKSGTAIVRFARPVVKSYKINQFTEICVDGTKAAASAIKVGMAVDVSADGLSSLDPHSAKLPVARTITARDAARSSRTK